MFTARSADRRSSARSTVAPIEEVSMHTFTSIDEIIGHLESLGRSPSAECDQFTELDHGLQCAAVLATTAPDDIELQVAGLLHDLANQWDGPGQSGTGNWAAASRISRSRRSAITSSRDRSSLAVKTTSAIDPSCRSCSGARE
jgi:hypothetical protein